jgi:sporulation protein YlmC with PRC-barrel domain
MEIEYGTSVVDKNNENLGTVSYIIMDSWSGEPRKFMVRQEEGAVFFTPEHIVEVTKEKVKLNLSAEELEQA